MSSNKSNPLGEFRPSANKNIIRKCYDKPLVRGQFLVKNQKLSYFGLPSEGLFDILEWLEFLYRYTAVERGEEAEPYRKQNLLMLNAIKHGINRNLQLLSGELDEILIMGKDEFDVAPNFPFDVANLDYYGGVLEPGSVRVQAIEGLSERQRTSDFILLMTFDMVEDDRGEKVKTIDRIQQEFLQVDTSKKAEILNQLKWYKSQNIPDAFRQKLYVTYFIKTTGEAKHYKVEALKPIMYLGTKNAPMTHFAFKLVYDHTTTTKAVSDQSLIEILNLRMQEVKNGHIVDSDIQPPLT